LASVAFGAVASADECDDKCEKAYKGKKWWIDQCKKKNKCASVSAPAPAPAPSSGGSSGSSGTKASGGAPASAPGSCGAKCEQSYKGMPFYIDKCKRDKCRSEEVEKGIQGSPAFSTGSCQQNCELTYKGMSWHIAKCKKDKCKEEIEANKQNAGSYEQLKAELQGLVGQVTDSFAKLSGDDCPDRAHLKKMGEAFVTQAKTALTGSEQCTRARTADQLKNCMGPLTNLARVALTSIQPLAAQVGSTCAAPKTLDDPRIVEGTDYYKQTVAFWEAEYAKARAAWGSLGDLYVKIKECGPVHVMPNFDQPNCDPRKMLSRSGQAVRGLYMSKEQVADCFKRYDAYVQKKMAELRAAAKLLENAAMKAAKNLTCKTLTVLNDVGEWVEKIWQKAKEKILTPVWEWAKKKFHEFAQKSPMLKPIDDLINGGSLANAVQGLTKELAKAGRDKLIDYLAGVLVNAVAKKPLQNLTAWVIDKVLSIADPFLTGTIQPGVAAAIAWAIGVLQAVPVVGQALLVVSPVAGPLAAKKLVEFIRKQASKAIASFISDKASGLLVPLVRPLVNFAYDKLVGVLRSKFPAVFAQVETTAEEKKGQAVPKQGGH
jgi:hypothetical protein